MLIILIGALKLVSFFSPLLLNKVSSSLEAFGVFEYSFNLGQILMPLLGMGLSGGYAFYVLKHRQNYMKTAFHFHFVLLTALALLSVFIYPKILDNIYYGACLIALSFANQVFISGLKKIEDKNYASVFVESGLYVILMATVLTFVLFEITFNFQLWFLSLLIYNCLLSVIYHRKHIKFKEIKKKHLIQMYLFGVMAMTAGMLVFLLCTSTRVFTSFFLNNIAVGHYSLIFRIGAASILIYKAVIILIYKNLYLSDFTFLDKMFIRIIIGVILVNILLFPLFPHISNLFIDKTDMPTQIDNRLILTIFLQIILWVNFSLLEPIFQRENILKQQIAMISMAVLVMFFSMWFIHSYSELELLDICLINNIMISITTVFALFYLKRKKIILKKTLTISIIMLLITITNSVI